MADTPDRPFWQAVRGEIPPPPSAALLGWKVLEAVPGSGRIRIEFTATDRFTNVIGVVQGGFLCAMLDDTLGPALVTLLEPYEFCPTLELKVSFLRVAQPGRLVPVSATAPWRCGRWPSPMRCHTLSASENRCFGPRPAAGPEADNPNAQSVRPRREAPRGDRHV